MEIRIKEHSFLAWIAAKKLRARKVALVIGNTIYLHNTSRLEFLNDNRWLLHELKHVEQFQKHGKVAFIIRYCLESIRKGYYNNRFEVEARAAESGPLPSL